MKFSLDYIRKKINDITDSNKDYGVNDFENEFSKTFVGEGYDYDLFKLNVGFKNESNNPDPEYATNGSSGFDLRANLNESVTLKSGNRAIIPTGLYFEIPENFEIQIRPRSGLAAKNGVTVLNTPGTIDSDYTGEIKIILINHGDEDFTINHGDRIAQGVLASVLNKKIIKLTKQTNITSNTERGNGGFGSTGIQ
jgi:dUTP pyrophosphatase